MNEESKNYAYEGKAASDVKTEGLHYGSKLSNGIPGINKRWLKIFIKNLHDAGNISRRVVKNFN